MANEEHLAILRQGVDVWNAWREANPDVMPDLVDADLSETVLTRSEPIWRDPNWFEMRDMVLTRSELTWWEPYWSEQRKAVLTRADLTGADLTRADLTRADLRVANLIGANLREAKLRETFLPRAELRGADLRGAILNGAILNWADLSGTILAGATLVGTDLSEADLSGAYLNEAELAMANLSGTHLKGAYLGYTSFGHMDLGDALELETVIHDFPSLIGIETLVKSRGKIPKVFLRGCGVPDSFIEYLPALLGAMEPIQFYSCFISYSTKDEDFARRLHGRMQQEHLRVWFAPEDMEGGKKLHEQIERAIQYHDRLLLILSDNSLQSEWVMTELYNARQVELRENRRKLFPIRLADMDTIKTWKCFDADTGKDLAREIREYYIPDFSHWKNHESFEREFAKLLNALKATEALPIPRTPSKPKPKDMPQDPDKIIARLKQRLAILEEQAAITGISVRPEVAIEIGDLRAKIRELSSAR
jgi:uncharacterized protein YjbI with pentapeptide repeats